MKWKLSTKKLLLLVLIVETLFLFFLTYQTLSSFFPGTKIYKAGTHWRPNPTWKSGGLNTTFMLGQDFALQNISYPDLSLKMMKDNVGYWLNVTSGADAQITVDKWFETTAPEVLLIYSTSGSFNNRLYVGSKGRPTKVVGVASWEWNNPYVDFLVMTPNTVQISWEGALTYDYTFRGLFDETTGLPIYDRNVTVTAYFVGAENASESFVLNGTYQYQPDYKPLYFHFDLQHMENVCSQYGLNIQIYNESNYYDILFPSYEENTDYTVKVSLTWNTTYTITNKEETGCRINFDTPPTEGDEFMNWYVYRSSVGISKNREYWLSETEYITSIYVFDDDLTDYTFIFLDLAGALDDYPYVESQYYINGTLRTVDKRKVDVEKKIQMSLVNGRKYNLIIKDGSSYTFGDLLMTSTTTIQLTLKGIGFPKETLFTYKFVRIYGTRAFGSSGTGNISITYQDVLEQTTSVKIEIDKRDGTNVYTDTKTDDSFVQYWLNAKNDTDYTVVCTITHERYGTYEWKQYFPRTFSTNPWGLDFLGTSLPFATSIILPSLLILFVAGAFSQINAQLGAFLAVVTAIILTYMGWINISAGYLITAFSLVILMALVYAKRRVHIY